MSDWNPAKVWRGADNQKCHYCGQFIHYGEWSKQHRAEGFILHDDCAEDSGAYEEAS